MRKVLAHPNSAAINRAERRIKRILVLCWLLLFVGALCCLFWFMDWQNTPPTAIPSGYISADLWTGIQLSLQAVSTKN